MNRILDSIGQKIAPRPKLSGKVAKLPEPTTLAPPQRVALAVGRHSTPSERAIRWQLSPELRALLK